MLNWKPYLLQSLRHMTSDDNSFYLPSYLLYFGALLTLKRLRGLSERWKLPSKKKLGLRCSKTTPCELK